MKKNGIRKSFLTLSLLGGKFCSLLLFCFTWVESVEPFEDSEYCRK